MSIFKQRILYMHVILVDTDWSTFLPLTYIRPVSRLQIGAFTISEKWEHMLGATIGFKTKTYLSNKFPENKQSSNIYVNSSVIPTKELAEEVKSLSLGQGIEYQGKWVACHLESFKELDGVNFTEAQAKVIFLRHWWNMYYHAGEYIKQDLDFFYKDFNKELPEGNQLVGSEEELRIHPTANVEGAILNTRNGPIIIEEGATVMEGACLRGPIVIKQFATIKMGAKIYGPTIIGEGCKIGGEVKNSVFMSYSNKAHDGYVGNSVVGAWVNMGANTSMSNLKNTLGTVKVWSIAKEEFVPTHKQFVGGCIGDHSKFAIQTKLTTGSVVGIFSNILDDGFPPKFVPNFYWSNSKWFGTEKMEEVNERMHQLSKRPVSQFDIEIFEYLYQHQNDELV